MSEMTDLDCDHASEDLPVARRLRRTSAQLTASDGPFPQSPLVLLVQVAFAVLFELVLLCQVLEAACRHGCSISWGMGA